MNKKELVGILEQFKSDDPDELYDMINYINTQSNEFDQSDRNELIYRCMHFFHKLYGIENIKEDLKLPIKPPDKNVEYNQFLEYLESLKQYEKTLMFRPEIKNYFDYIKSVCSNRLLDMTDFSWTRIYSSTITKKDINILGKMYVSVDNKDLYRFANLLLVACINQGIPDFEFKVNNDETVTRRDSVTIFFTQENLVKYMSLIKQIIKENPDIKLNSQNPLGYSIDGIMCFGKDFSKDTDLPNDKKTFTDECCKAIVSLRKKDFSDTQIAHGLEIVLNKYMGDIIEIISKNQNKAEHIPEHEDEHNI